MDLTRKYRLIEKIVALQDESILLKLEESLAQKPEPTKTTSSNGTTTIKQDGIVLKRSIYRISDRPTTIKQSQPTPKREILTSQKEESSSLSKLQKLVSLQSSGL